MAELANRRDGAARLAVHIDVLRSDDQRGLVVSGPVFTLLFARILTTIKSSSTEKPRVDARG